MSRWYHNTTSRYNGFFYAGEIIKENVQRMEKSNVDDYTRVLPLFIYPDAQGAKTYYPEMDKSIKKTSLVIQRHTIVDKKGKEIAGAVKWIDDNYLVLGKAHFYKREFFDAIESFEYVAKTYKKDINRYVARLWLVRTYNEMGTLSQSAPIIDLLNNDKEFPKKLQGEFSSLVADFYMRRLDYDNAIKHLTKAIALTKKKQTRARYTFILAQLHEQTGNRKKAAELYANVIKMKPPYEMVFNSRIKRAGLFEANSGNSREMKKQLLRMLRDAKNIEYLDQIYYALALIEEKEKHFTGTGGAIDYLKQSARYSTSNVKQKGLSYLKLANIYFEAPDYRNAQAYFDSSIIVLPKDYPGYEQISEKKKSLTALVSNLNIITLEDSLQKLAKLTEAEREQVITAIIQREEERERAKIEEKQNALNNPMMNAGMNNNAGMGATGANGAGGVWIMYNPSAVSFGMQEFAKRWGDRQLEDHWRRSNRQSIAMDEMEMDRNPAVDSTGIPAGTAGDKGQAAAGGNKKSKDYYLKTIPTTVEMMEKSNARIIDAYYNVGSIYKEQLMNYEKSADAFEELLRRYRENKHKLSAYYQLYRIYTAMGSTSKADYYKNLLLNDYPDTEYAKLIRNPDHARESAASKNEVETFYAETYSAYVQGRYEDVIANVQKAEQQYAKNFLMPKFDFLRALAIGKTQGQPAFEGALTQITIKYPKDEVKPKAEEILAILKKDAAPPAKKDSAAVSGEKPLYTFTPDAEHSIIIVAAGKRLNITNLKTKLSDFNAKFYGTVALNIGQVGLDADMQIINIKSFSNAEKAIEYYSTLKTNPDVFKNAPEDGYMIFAISNANYQAFYKDKDVMKYMRFFKEMYPAD